MVQDVFQQGKQMRPVCHHNKALHFLRETLLGPTVSVRGEKHSPYNHMQKRKVLDSGIQTANHKKDTEAPYNTRT